jgi:hypothetical protein
MCRKFLITSVAVTALSLAVVDVHAQGMGSGARSGANINASTHSFGMSTHSRAANHSRAQARGPVFKPVAGTTAERWGGIAGALRGPAANRQDCGNA